MDKKVRHIVCLLLVLFSGAMGQISAQIYDADGQYVDTIFHDHVNRQAEDFVKVSLVVCEPCDVLYSTLGHACLHLECEAFGLDYFFSYESESVRDKVWAFLKGDLTMGMFAIEREEFLQEYRESGRGVKEYKMNLSPEQKQELWRIVDQKVGEGSNIPYDYFHKGCAKSVVLVMKEALGADAIDYGPWSEKYTRQTQRELVRNYIEDAPWSEFEMYFLIGTDGDKDYPCEQKLIVPTDLVEVWQQATINGQNLLAQEPTVLVESTATTTTATTTIWKKVLTPLMVAILLLIVSWWTPWPMLVVQTLIGWVMLYLIGFSDLPCTDWNWLIIPFNPLPALAWHWRRYWVLPYAGVLVVWMIVMLSWPHTLVDWSHIVLVAAWTVALVMNYVASTRKKQTIE